MSGRDGQSVLWERSDLDRAGLPVRDVTGDGKYDYAIGQCCWQDGIYLLNGANGQDVWQANFGAFDLMGIIVVPGTSDFIISAQGSSGGGVRKYQGTNGQALWSCPPVYNNNTLIGLIPGPSGCFVLADGGTRTAPSASMPTTAPWCGTTSPRPMRTWSDWWFPIRMRMGTATC